ncbi:hypothetical protein [Undibacterium parvum]|uniref:hypothetical protein n=1 Tax=Undibacterium parvum TaxID=401471 RepID=UPI001D1325D3|nr:hypothetical protein [Undibacterium parvum]
MKIKRLPKIRTLILACLSAALTLCAAARAESLELSEQELADVSGQGLTILSNSSYNGLDFSRITLNADLTLNVNFKNIVLGQYNYAPNNGLGADINMPALQFGRSDGTAAQRLVQISNPYLEFVYDNTAGAGNNKMLGLRVGFDGISGDIGMRLASLSGSMLVDGGAAGILDSNAGSGKRWDGSCPTGGSGCLAMSQLGGVTAGNAAGPSRDFWISMLSAPVQFQGAAGMAQPALAQSGAWMNFRDRLTAIVGALPPNLALGR